MKYLKYLGLAGWLICMVCISASQTPRTPYGELWAGTTLQLGAMAFSSTGQTLALSRHAEVRVGRLVRWRVDYESMPFGTTDRDAWFTLLVENRGNAVDTLFTKLSSSESPDTSAWQLDLYEELSPEQTFNNARWVNESLTLFFPGEQRRLYLRARAPSDRNTDGVFIHLKAFSQQDPNFWFERVFVVGVEAVRNPNTNALTWGSYLFVAPPTLIAGRLWWVASSGNNARVFFTPQPLTETGSFANNIQVGAKLVNLQPSGHGIFAGDWLFLINLNGIVSAFPLSALSQTTSLQPTNLNLPALVRTNIAPVSDEVLVFFADITNQVIVFDPRSGISTTLLSPADSPIVRMYALPDRIVVVARADGAFEVIQNGVRMRGPVRFPYTGAIPISGVASDNRRGTLLVSAGTWLGCYNPRSNRWLWAVNLGAPIVAEPVYDYTTDSCYALTSGGVLYAFDSAGGTIRPLYPRQCFNGTISKATMTALARQDRKVSYVYVSARMTDGTNEVRMITALNPFNRFFSTNIPAGGQLGEGWLITGNSANDFLITWFWRGIFHNDTERSAFYVFRPR